MDKDVILCLVSPQQRAEIRRCFSKLELLRFLNRRLHATHAKRLPNQNPFKTRTLTGAAIPEAIGSSRDFETMTGSAEAAKCHGPANRLKKSDG
jgi:hypothetical protein